MGRVTTAAKIENLQDLWLAETGAKPPESVRCVEIDDALVDTGAMILSLPTRLIQQLGLRISGQKRTITTGGPRMANVYQAVKLTVQDRDCIVEVLEVSDSVPVLIGQVPLEVLDFVVDVPNRRLIGNPAHGGLQMFEMF